MKKHKSVVAILLAVMMVFTMMPMMAFADAPKEAKDKAKFNSDYSEVTIPAYVDGTGSDAIQVPEKTYKTVRTYSDGIITAVPDPKGADDYSWDMPTGISAQYIDLSTAELAEADGKTLKSEYAFGTLNPSKFTSIKLNAPSYVEKDAAGKLPAAVTKDFAWLEAATKWEGKVVGFEEFKSDVRTEQNFTVSFGGEYTDTVTENDTPILGTIAVKNVKVNAATPDPSADAKYLFDGSEVATDVTKSGVVTTYYDGAAHTFAATEVSGWTASYSTYDAKTGKWTPATAITLSDVPEKAVYVKVDWTKAGEKEADKNKAKTLYVNLVPAGKANVGFVAGEDGYIYSVPGTQYDASSYIGATPVLTETYSKDADERAKEKFKDAALTKAVEANKAELVAYQNELNEVSAKVSKYNPNAVGLTYAAKDLTTKEVTAITDKYKALDAKFEKVEPGVTTATVALNGVDLTDFEIEFTNAPAKKVIKTKKAKSTKTVKFNVKADCKNGTLVKYKLINAPKKSITIDANTGKITVKKGLAKGTYTFKIKAYIPVSRVRAVVGDEDYVGGTAFSEIQTIKVVVKKTKK